MRKFNQDTTSFVSENEKNKNIETDKIKTTNVNILLNRVRLDKKRTLKKKIIFVTALALLLSILVAYLII